MSPATSLITRICSRHIEDSYSIIFSNQPRHNCIGWRIQNLLLEHWHEFSVNNITSSNKASNSEIITSQHEWNRKDHESCRNIKVFGNYYLSCRCVTQLLLLGGVSLTLLKYYEKLISQNLMSTHTIREKKYILEDILDNVNIESYIYRFGIRN